MASVIYGNDRFLVLEKANQLFESFSSKNDYVEKIVFQTSDQGFEFKDVEASVETVSLFGAPKWIFLYVETDKDYVKLNEAMLLRWLEMSATDVMFVLSLPKKLPTKHPLRKAISSSTTEYTVSATAKDGLSVQKRINQSIQKHNISIDDGARALLNTRIGSDSGRVSQEVEKLRLLNRMITIRDIEDLVSYDMQHDIFSLGNALLQKNQHEAFRIYHQLLKQKNDPLSLSALIASSLRSIYQVESLQSLNYSAAEIRDILKMSEGQYWNVTRRRFRSKSAILEILNSFSQFDQESKLGKKDRFVGFELLMLSIMM